MKPADQLSEFARQAVAEGHDRTAIAQALARAGWSHAEIADALDSWADEPGLPPVPRPRPYVSAREALLYGLMFLSLGMVVWHVVQLGFAATDRLLPAYGSYSGSDDSLRWSVASLIAFLPMFVILNRYVNRSMDAAAPARRRSLVRKWFASITLLIAAMALLGDLVYAIYALLNGDMTLRFLVKAGIVAVMGGLVLAYYRAEVDD